VQGMPNPAQTLHSVSHCSIRLCAGLQGVQGFFYTCARACAREAARTIWRIGRKTLHTLHTLHKTTKNKDLGCAGFHFHATATLHTLHTP